MRLTTLFFSFSGRIGRSSFFLGTVLIWTLFFNINYFLEQWLGSYGTVLLYIPFVWGILALCVKRYHDVGKSGKHLLLMLIPLIGPVWVFMEMLIRKGMIGSNRFGESPRGELVDYLRVSDSKDPFVVDDVTQINPVKVTGVVAPTNVNEVIEIVRQTKGQLSIGGGRFSMGGQTSSPGATHIDLRKLNKIITFNALEKKIRVQAGVRWCDIQRTIDNQDLSVKIMQTYANFTVGGSLSVNSHGRYMGLGPLILSVNSIAIVLSSGELIEAGPDHHAEIFYGAIGGYGALGVIVEAELSLTENVRVERHEKKLSISEYKDFFFDRIRSNKNVVFHNADIYPPHYNRLRAVSWIKTDRPVTSPYRLMPLQKSYPVHRYFYWAFSETITGKWRREFIIEPIVYRKKIVHWRNYEAGYDAGELEPSSRLTSTYVLQEYFVPVERFNEFLSSMTTILKEHKVNMINISVRHAYADPGSYLAWAKKEMFAFVLYYKQKTNTAARDAVKTWTQSLIDAALKCDGTYYLPYQPHATSEQFHSAYPGAKRLFELKKKVDPDFRFTNSLWDKYYKPTLTK
jgi:FAD/FMN-containing dehydrogenase/uncharacterized membrane protein YhaH (DUF805 family)